MFKNYFAVFLVLFVIVFGAVPAIFASEFALNTIGGVAVSSQTITEWSHATTNPSFRGTAPANASVTIKIDDLSNTVTADSSGDWVFYPTSLKVGEYQVSISSGAKQIKFILTIGSTNSSVANSPTPTANSTLQEDEYASDSTTLTTKGGLPEKLPRSGSFETTLAILAFGLVSLGLGMIAWPTKEQQ